MEQRKACLATAASRIPLPISLAVSCRRASAEQHIPRLEEELPDENAEDDDHEEYHEDFDQFEFHRVNQFGFLIVSAA